MRNNFLHNFAGYPEALSGKLSGFDKASKHLTSIAPGLLIPMDTKLTCPHEIWSGDSTDLVRALAQFSDVPQGEMYLDCYYFFTPLRILYKHWEEFEGENKSTAGARQTEVVLPYFRPAVKKTKVDSIAITSAWNSSTGEKGWAYDFAGNAGGFTTAGSLDSYLGYNIVSLSANPGDSAYLGPACNGLDIINYYRIWNDYFRDQNLQAPLAGLDTYYNLASGAAFDPASLFNGQISSIRGLSGMPNSHVTSGQAPCLLAPVNKYHDYFTSCLPNPTSKVVYLPLAGTADVVAVNSVHSMGNALKLTNSTGDFTNGQLLTSSYNVVGYASSLPGDTSNITQSNLVANLGTANAISVDTLRTSIAASLYYEALCLGGQRYIETRKSIWDEEIFSDLIQRPEYLGGDHIQLNLQTTNATSAAEGVHIGRPSSNSVTACRSTGRFIKRIKEFGFITRLICVRYKHDYGQGLRRDKMLHRLFDFYNPYFDKIGNTPVYKDEIATGARAVSSNVDYIGDNSVFGYQEAWADYRDGSVDNRVSGVFNPDAGEADFAAWSFSDSYTAQPTLSGSWICEDPINLRRCQQGLMYGPYAFAVTSFSNLKAYRHMSAYSKPSKLGM